MPSQRIITCEGCGKPLKIAAGEDSMRKQQPDERAANAKYHSNACKQKAYRKRKANLRVKWDTHRYHEFMARARYRNTAEY